MRRFLAAWRWILGSLLLGLVTTIAVCWSIAAFMPFRGWSETQWTVHSGDSAFQGTTCYATGAQIGAWFHRVPLVPGLDAKWVRPRPVEALSADGGAARRRWQPAWGLSPGSESPLSDVFQHATGWPLLATWYCVDLDQNTNPTQTAQGGINLPKDPRTPWTWNAIRALPLRPIWIGLLIDTAFYGVIWAGLLAGGRGLRSRFRRRRNRCTRCNYSLAGLPTDAACPECGPERPGSPTPQAANVAPDPGQPAA